MYPRTVEWPTIWVAAAIATGFAAVLVGSDHVPLLVELVVLAVSAAWFNSLQHEIIHGHPTPWRSVNTALGSIPFGMVFPLARYRDTHLAHHHDEILTDPVLDPESFYVTAEEWARRGPAGRWLLLTLQTLAGRMLLGPPVYAVRFWCRYVVSWRSDVRQRREGLLHVAAVVGLVSVVYVSPLSMWVYLVGAVWAGASLSLVRSFAEHRAVESGSRTAVVHAGRCFSVLFLNNNLHTTHHDLPGLAWFEIPAAHAQLSGDAEAARGAGLYEGYGEVARRFMLRPTWVPVHPTSIRSS